MKIQTLHNNKITRTQLSKNHLFNFNVQKEQNGKHILAQTIQNIRKAQNLKMKIQDFVEYNRKAQKLIATINETSQMIGVDIHTDSYKYCMNTFKYLSLFCRTGT